MHLVKTYFLYHIRREIHANNLKEGYVGISHRPKLRLNEHKRTKNPHLRNAFKKYDDIEMVLISSGSLDEVLEMEKWLRPNKKMGWNIAEGGGMPPIYTGEDHYFYGKSHNDETKKMIGDANRGRTCPWKGKQIWDDEAKERIGAQHRGKKLSKAHKEVISKKVSQFTLDGEFVAEYSSQLEAAKAVGQKGSAAIARCCAGQQKTSSGFIWKFS